MIQIKKNDFINQERGTKLVTEFLDLVQKRKTINKKIGTYGLKHVVERWAEKKHGGYPNDNYIDEGILINVAIEKGFKAVPASLNEIDKYMEDLFPYGNYKMYLGHKVSI